MSSILGEGRDPGRWLLARHVCAVASCAAHRSGRADYPGFRGVSTFIRIVLLTVVAGLYALVQLWIRDGSVDMQSAIPVLIGGLFIALGAPMGKRPDKVAPAGTTPGE